MDIQIDVNTVIQKLTNRIGALEFEKAMLEAQLEAAASTTETED